MSSSIAILFDMDGTLLELPVDIDGARQALAAMFLPWGVDRPFRPILARIREAAAEAGSRGGDPRLLARAGFDVLDRFELEAARHARPRPGAPQVIDALAQAGIPLGLVTNNGRACVGPALEAAGLSPQAFAAIATRDDVLEPKPDPAGILQVTRALPACAKLWYVGDQVSDIKAGQAAAATLPGLRTVAIPARPGDGAALELAKPDHMLLELADLLQRAGIP